MMKNLKFVAVPVLLAALAFVIIFSIPKQYEVAPFKERPGTKYWQLATGSKIGYTKIVANSSEQKAPLIYLHGGPGGKITDDVITALSPLSQAGHDVYVYDQIGSGHSARLPAIADYSVERHREDLRAIVAEIGADKVILIGHSWGACLATNYLQEYPTTVEKIILTGPGPILPMNRRLANVQAPDSLQLIEPEYSNQAGNKKAYSWRSRAVLKWAQLFSAKLVSDEEADDFFTFLNQALSQSTYCTIGEAKKYTGGGGYYSHVMTMKSINNVADGRERLQELDTPMLILRGQCDNQKWGYVQEYLELFQNAKLEIIAGVGHDIVGKDKEAYYRLLSQFLAEE